MYIKCKTSGFCLTYRKQIIYINHNFPSNHQRGQVVGKLTSLLSKADNFMWKKGMSAGLYKADHGGK